MSWKTTEYHYKNGDIAVRYDHGDGTKHFIRKHVDQETGEVLDGKSPLPPVLYRVDELEGHETVYWVEGEKCADALWERRFPSTTSIGGAANFHSSSPAAKEALKGKRVVIFPDNDDPGRSYAEDVAKALRDEVRSLRIAFLPGLEEKEDIYDFFEKGGDILALNEAIEQSTELATYAPLGRDVVDVFRDPVDGDPDSDRFWVIPGFVPANALTILGGPPKVGKTFMALDMGVAVSHRARFLSTFDVHPGRVLMLLEEDPEHVSKARLRAMFAGREISPERDSLKVIMQSGILFDDPSWWGRLVKEVEFFRPKLLITDALSRVHMSDENSRSEMSKVLRPLHRLCAENGVAAVLLHHIRKLPPGERPSIIDLLRGTGDLPAQARSIIGAFEAESGMIEVEVRGNMETPDPFIAKLVHRVRNGVDETGWRVIGLKQAAQVEAAIPLVEGALRASSAPMNAKEIRREIGKKMETVLFAIRLLEERGVIRRREGIGWEPAERLFEELASGLGNAGETPPKEISENRIEIPSPVYEPLMAPPEGRPVSWAA